MELATCSRRLPHGARPRAVRCDQARNAVLRMMCEVNVARSTSPTANTAIGAGGKVVGQGGRQPTAVAAPGETRPRMLPDAGRGHNAGFRQKEGGIPASDPSHSRVVITVRHSGTPPPPLLAHPRASGNSKHDEPCRERPLCRSVSVPFRLCAVPSLCRSASVPFRLCAVPPLCRSGWPPIPSGKHSHETSKARRPESGVGQSRVQNRPTWPHSGLTGQVARVLMSIAHRLRLQRSAASS